MLKNLSVPGMDQMAERARTQMLEAGMIPESQWTNEERQQIEQMQAEQANQEPVEDPNMIIAQAEMGKAQAEQMSAQTRQQEAQFNAQVKQAEITLEQDKIALEREKLQLDAQKFVKGQDDKFNVDAAKITQGQQKIDLQAAQQEQKAVMEAMKLQQQQLNDSFTNLKTMLEAMGATSVASPQAAEVYSEQVEVIDNNQEDIERP
jgi:hypothetical protein